MLWKVIALGKIIPYLETEITCGISVNIKENSMFVAMATYNSAKFVKYWKSVTAIDAIWLCETSLKRKKCKN